MRTLVASSLAIMFSACAMSEHAFGKLAGEVGERNDRRYAAAEAALRERGYTFADEQRFASLGERALVQCRSALMWGRVPAGWESARLELSIAEATPAGATPSSPVAMQALAPDACLFFRGQSPALDVRLPDGSETKLRKIGDDQRLARDRAGALVVVNVSQRVVSRRKVVVERFCNLIPRVGADPLEHPAPMRVVLADRPLPAVDMAVEHEALDVTCTDNAY